MPFTALKEALEPFYLPIILALFGGLARFCRGREHSWRQLVSGLVVSGFAGTVVSLFIADTALSFTVKAAIIAMAGYMGGWVLDAIARRLAKAVEQVPAPTQGKE